MHTPERICLGLDDSESGTAALRWAAARAHDHPVLVRIVRVLGDLEPDMGWSWFRLDAARETLDRVAPDVRIETETAFGSVPHRLAEISAADDLLVVGSHRSHRLRSALTGLLPDRIAGRSLVPTVIVPDDWSGRRSGVVTLAVDGDTAPDALDFAVAEAARSGTSLRIVHAWRVPAPLGPPTVALMEEAPEVHSESAKNVLASFVDRARAIDPALRVQSQLMHGAPAVGVRAAADGSRMVVIGRRHRAAISGELIGSTGQDLVGASPIPLCVVPRRIA